jgi:hypothetical protein
MFKTLLFLITTILFVGCVSSPSAPQSQTWANPTDECVSTILVYAPVDDAMELTNPVQFSWRSVDHLNGHYEFYWGQDAWRVKEYASAHISLGSPTYPIWIDKDNNSMNFELGGFGRFVDVGGPNGTGNPDGIYNGKDYPIIHYWRIVAYDENNNVVDSSPVYSFWMKI